jgi:hypothetical protein
VQHRGRSGRVVLPIMGSAAAVAAGGALAAVAEATPAVPEAGDGSFGSLGGAPGTFESCDAFFGFGKELVAFHVVDQNGADGIPHAVPSDSEVVPGDTQVVFVLEDEDGDPLECTPVEVSEDEWDFMADNGPFPNFPPYPGPGHYVYPSIERGASIDQGDFGRVEFVGFRVVDVPTGHTLVSPTGTEELLQSQLDPDALDSFDQVDPRTLDHITTAEGAAAAGAFDDAVDACDDDPDAVLSGDDLADAVAAIEALIGADYGAVDCNDIGSMNRDASILLGLQESIAYTETITLALPQVAASTTVAPTTTTTAGPSTTTTVAPTTTTARVLARTGAGRSGSLPVALVGIASIAGGAIVLGARRRLR